ncbi:hypothetical protein CHU95_20730 [Niveispirillum lacus]|uniref:Glycosyl transferase family 1 domain-containing protein n=1 Tax=Niveispirillum lacus TaxID=1981099 RepID=A0A255YSZ8_9PROT|nr:glycosyltransferase [Niveispirillum lacus]OYQ31570.1 hypothetical protein CHU95_20730 [Niveispirillum lacus]
MMTDMVPLLERPKMRGTGVKVVGLADVALGYGYQQLELMVTALAQKYGAAEAYIVEPDMKFRRQMHEREGLRIVRFGSRMPPHDETFHIEYNIQIERFLKEVEPDIVVFVNAAVLPALLLQKRRPPLCIYYMLESLHHQRQAGGENFIRLNEMAKHLVDLVIVPERRRADHDLTTLGWNDARVVEVLNLTHQGFTPPAVKTEPSFMYAGTIGRQTQCHYLLDSALSGYRIDLAGPAYSEDANQILKSVQERNNIRYLGVLSSLELDAVRQQYAYSIVMWAPTDINQLYASPNKFFEAIASGVPPICAPHPQCAEVIDEFGCGLLMEDWSLGAFIEAMKEASSIVGTSRYEQLVANCKIAVEEKLNIPEQFKKVEMALEAFV